MVSRGGAEHAENENEGDIEGRAALDSVQGFVPLFFSASPAPPRETFFDFLGAQSGP